MKNLRKWGRQTTERGGVLATWYGHRLLILVSDAEVADFLLKTCLQKDDMMQYMRFVFGNASTFAPVHIWRPRRKAVAPAFSQKNLSSFASVFADGSRALVDRLHGRTDADVALWPYMAAYSFEAACETTFGVTVDAQSDTTQSFVKSFGLLTTTMAAFLFRPYLHNWTLFKWLFYLTGCTNKLNVINKFVDNIVTEKKEELRQENIRKAELGLPQNGPRSFLKFFMESSIGGKAFTDTQLREESMVMVLAASETSAVAVSFAVMMLARYPEVQEKVYQEIQEVLGKTFRPPTMEELPRLKYLEATIKETMRLYPSIPLVARKVETDVTLPTGVTLLKGCGIIVSIDALHRNPKYWGKDADYFKPERFLGSPLPYNAAYIPFASGTRGCIGYRYAMMSMKTALATLLQQYRVLPAGHSPDSGFTPCDEVSKPLHVYFDVMMKEVNHFKVKLESRQ
ncbi:hypothetical protein ABMA28_015942 [Loxostege sticticalis]|uniref:Cytochrome P450 n=1 Tax=Loxostege sticticalis TaxID=481309 RepID=A0ABD0TBV7_LOXSC